MGIKTMLEVFPQERGTIRPARDCAACCFFHLVETKGKRRRICQLTGEKRPWAGMDGCNFIQGQWSQIDAILLAKSRLFRDNNGPNVTKPGSGLPNVTMIALDDFSADAVNHIAEKAERRFAVPEPVRAGGVTSGRL